MEIEPRTPARLLVIEDDPLVREMLADALGSSGYAVIAAPDGREAVRRCRVERVDLVIVDLYMPEQDGLETIRALRAELPELPIIAISGGGELRLAASAGGMLRLASAFGANRALEKPLAIRQLLDTVRDLLPAVGG
jgi:CheY-like chemotaxis protein